MRPASRPPVLAALALCAALAACGGSGEPSNGEHSPASVEPIKGTDLNRITLSAAAAARTGIRTVPLRGGRRLAIPYSAVMYTPTGDAFVYTSPSRLTYVRAPIVIARIAGGMAYLRKGPKPGTLIVTVGSAELLGTEEGVQED